MDAEKEEVGLASLYTKAHSGAPFFFVLQANQHCENLPLKAALPALEDV